MLVSNVSLWGAAIVACFVLVGSIVLGFFDRNMLRRVLAVFGVTVAQMAVIAVVVLVITAATFVANVLTGVIALLLIRSSDPK